MELITELTEDEVKLLSAYRAISADMQVKFLKYILRAVKISVPSYLEIL